MQNLRILAALAFGICFWNACSDEQPGRVRMATTYESEEAVSNSDSIAAPDREAPPMPESPDPIVQNDPSMGDDDVTEDIEPVFASGDARFRCRASGAGGREADLRMENKGGDVRFRAKWEIDVGQGQVPGTVVNVAISGVSIGGITLSADGDQLEGDIERRGGNLPAVIRNIRAGTPVEIGALRCSFARD